MIVDEGCQLVHGLARSRRQKIRLRMDRDESLSHERRQAPGFGQPTRRRVGGCPAASTADRSRYPARDGPKRCGTPARWER